MNRNVLIKVWMHKLHLTVKVSKLFSPFRVSVKHEINAVLTLRQHYHHHHHLLYTFIDMNCLGVDSNSRPCISLCSHSSPERAIPASCAFLLLWQWVNSPRGRTHCCTCCCSNWTQGLTPTLVTACCRRYRVFTTATFLRWPSVSGPITWLASPWVHNWRQSLRGESKEGNSIPTAFFVLMGLRCGSANTAGSGYIMDTLAANTDSHAPSPSSAWEGTTATYLLFWT